MSARRPSRLLLMIWDGMRPDLISPKLTPNLAALGAGGVVFEAHHAVLPTGTRVNAATLATGAPAAVHEACQQETGHGDPSGERVHSSCVH